MDMTERHSGDITVLDLAGKLTLGDGTQRLHDKINSLLLQDQKKIVLNLEKLDSMDSGGLGELVRTHTTVKVKGGATCLANPGKRIEDLLVLTKLYTVFDVCNSEADAIKSLSS